MSVALAGLMVLACALLPKSAHASCGDYVFVRDARGQLSRVSDLLKDHRVHGPSQRGCTGTNCPSSNLTGAQPEPAPASVEEGLPIQLPCHGPNCSSRTQLPAAPITPLIPQRTGQESTATLLNLHQTDDASRPRFGLFPSTSAHELHYSQFIFHPPR